KSPISGCRSATLQPRAPVALHCGSMSISRVRWPALAIAAARLTAVVVLPTPPFWLTTQMMRFFSESGSTVVIAVEKEGGWFHGKRTQRANFEASLFHRKQRREVRG